MLVCYIDITHPAGNTRDGKSSKKLKGEFGEQPIEITRDRNGSFEPQIIPKHQTRWIGFDNKILLLYARGMMVREIQSHLEEIMAGEKELLGVWIAQTEGRSSGCRW